MSGRKRRESSDARLMWSPVLVPFSSSPAVDQVYLQLMAMRSTLTAVTQQQQQHSPSPPFPLSHHSFKFKPCLMEGLPQRERNCATSTQHILIRADVAVGQEEAPSFYGTQNGENYLVEKREREGGGGVAGS